jgi:hypothetical protein
MSDDSVFCVRCDENKPESDLVEIDYEPVCTDCLTEPETALIRDGVGECDKCEETYDVGSQLDHCAKCGTCWSHCDCVSDA